MTVCWRNRPNAPSRAVAHRRNVGPRKHALRFVGVGEAHRAPHRQRLNDVHHVFVMHLDIAGERQRLVKHGGAGTSARNDEKCLCLNAHG